MSNRLGGMQGTAYLGTNANQPVNVTYHNDDPNQYDTQNYSIGDEWINQIALTAWKLVSLAGNNTSKGQLATWIQIGGGGSATTYVADSGNATPSSGILNVLGGPNINTSASGSTVDVSLNDNLVSLVSIETASLSVSGLGEGVVQSSSSGVLSSSEGTNGQILIGSSSGAPLWQNITAGENVTITNSANGIEIASIGGGSGGGSQSTIGNGTITLNNANFLSYKAPFDSVGGANNVIARAQYSIPMDGIIDRLRVYVGTNDSSADNTITLNVNGSNTSLVATIPGMTTGTFTDLIHSISVSAGDLITSECSIISGTGQEVVGTIAYRFTAAGGTGGGGSSSSISAGGTVGTLCSTPGITYQPLYNGTTAGSATIIDAQMVMPTDAVFDKLYVLVESNGNTATGSLALNVNGTDTSLSTSFGASSTGIFSNTVDTVSVSAGDLVTIRGSQAVTDVTRGGYSIRITTGSSGGSTTPSVASITLTSAQIKALHATPINIVAAPGAGKAIMPLQIIFNLNYGGTNAFTNAGSQSISLFYTNASSASNGCSLSGLLTNQIIATSNQIAFNVGVSNTTDTIAINAPVVVSQISATEIGGNAAGDNTIDVTVYYYTITP